MRFVGSEWLSKLKGVGGTRCRWTLRGLAACLPLLAAVAAVQAAEPELTREARIKSVLILRMIKFVEWPAEALTRGDTFQLCTWGDSATSVALQSLQGQRVREHEIRVRKLQNAPALEARGCHVLFVADTRSDFNVNALNNAAGKGLLSISDMPDFGKRGGIFTLVQQDNKISFEVQLRHARASGLQIGAPLLELARSVD